MPSKRPRKANPTYSANNTYAAGFMLAAVGYCVLAFLGSLTPARLSWWLLAILVIPALTGVVAARGTSKIDSRAERFASGFWTCVIPMFLYVGIRLMVAHHRVGPSGHAAGVLFVGALVTLVYTLLAGIVAGLASIVFYLQTDRRGGHA